MIDRLRAHLPHFTRYMVIGGFVFAIDYSLYKYLLFELHTALWEAVTVSQTVALLIHFTLNKFLNFRAHDRSARDQFGTYLIVAGFCILVSQVVVYGWVALFGNSDLMLKLAKCAAVGVNIPIGFLGHKKLTFGGGLRAFTRRGGTQQAA